MYAHATIQSQFYQLRGASSTLQNYPTAKPMAMTAEGYRYYTVYYRNGAAPCGGGYGAHKCMAEIELYDS